jgi:hypothetical protein
MVCSAAEVSISLVAVRLTVKRESNFAIKFYKVNEKMRRTSTRRFPKGAFILTSDGKREKWDVNGPHFAGW